MGKLIKKYGTFLGPKILSEMESCSIGFLAYYEREWPKLDKPYSIHKLFNSFKAERYGE